MRETPGGLLVAAVGAERCTECGECLRCCPGPGVRVSPGEGEDAFAGRIVGAYTGHATSAEARRSGQSGGLIGALLCHLFETGEITGAVGVTFSSDGSLRPLAYIIRDPGEISATQGSKYCPVPLNVALKDISSEERLAYVGLPCHMHGVQKMLDARQLDPSVIRIKIGLVCDRVLMYGAIDRMARDLGVEGNDAVGFEYRSKARSGWPGEVCFTMRSGERRYDSQDLRRRMKDYATPPRCRVCFDKMNTFADIVVGDAWHIAESVLGDSVALSRTQVGEDTLCAAARAGAICLTDVAAGAVFESAGLEPLRRRFVAFSEARRSRSLKLPEVDGVEGYLGTPDWSERQLARQLTRLNLWVAASTSTEQAVRRIGLARMIHAPVSWALHLMSLVSRRLSWARRGSIRS